MIIFLKVSVEQRLDYTSDLMGANIMDSLSKVRSWQWCPYPIRAFPFISPPHPSYFFFWLNPPFPSLSVGHEPSQRVDDAKRELAGGRVQETFGRSVLNMTACKHKLMLLTLQEGSWSDKTANFFLDLHNKKYKSDRYIFNFYSHSVVFKVNNDPRKYCSVYPTHALPSLSCC